MLLFAVQINFDWFLVILNGLLGIGGGAMTNTRYGGALAAPGVAAMVEASSPKRLRT